MKLVIIIAILILSPYASAVDCDADNNSACPAWAESGECSKNPSYMLV